MRRFAICSVGVVSLAAWLGGCARPDPRTTPISAKQDGAIVLWLSAHAEVLTPEERKEFAAMVQEIRFDIVRAHGGNRPPDELSRRIDGHTFAEVLRLGHEAKIARLQPLRKELKDHVDQNGLIVTRAGDAAAAGWLDDYRAKQMERLTALEADIYLSQRRVAELTGRPVPEQSPAEAGPRPLPRDEARAGLDAMIQKRLNQALVKYGAVPARVVAESERVPPELRADFDARRAAARHNGHTVLAVHVRGQWLIFDEPAELPELTPAIRQNLSPADLKRVGEAWRRMQAEIWARREAYERAGGEPATALAGTGG